MTLVIPEKTIHQLETTAPGPRNLQCDVYDFMSGIRDDSAGIRGDPRQESVVAEGMREEVAHEGIRRKVRARAILTSRHTRFPLARVGLR